jgi:hypothetical protein
MREFSGISASGELPKATSGGNTVGASQPSISSRLDRVLGMLCHIGDTLEKIDNSIERKPNAGSDGGGKEGNPSIFDRLSRLESHVESIGQLAESIAASI